MTKINSYLEYYLVMVTSFIIGGIITAGLLWISCNPWIVPDYHFAWEYKPYHLLVYSLRWVPVVNEYTPVLFLMACGLWCLFFTVIYYQIQQWNNRRKHRKLWGRPRYGFHVQDFI